MATVRPLDPRLLRYAGAARGYVILTAVFGVVTAGLVVAQAIVLAYALAPLITGEASLPEVSGKIVALAIIFLTRSAVVGLQERFAHRAATRTITQLRSQILTHAASLGPRWMASGRGAQLTTLATRGLEDLEPYFVRYLPQLLLAATVTPATLVVVWWQDWTAGLTILITLPLVPIFMILVGKLTESASRKKIATMQRLGAQVLDLIAGLPTLKALGREVGPGARVRKLGEAHRRTTMGTLRIAFLSGMVLELLTTLSVALVAVGIGMRLVYGWMDLTVGLAVLVLAPEVFFPIRQVGTHFHASSDGVAAAEEVFAILEHPITHAALGPHAGSVPIPDLHTTTIRVRDLTMRAGDRDVFAPYRLSFDIKPGTIVALQGPNGSGKSTASLALLNLLRPDEGEIHVGDTALSQLCPTSWWRNIAWVPQRAMLIPGTVAENVLLDVSPDSPIIADDAPNAGAGQTGSARLTQAAHVTGLSEVVDSLPDGWRTRLGHGGVGLSLGQRQRVALTRALVKDAPLVVVDEPTAHLDSESEQVILDGIQALRDQGRTVLLIAHRDELLNIADDVISVASRDVSTPPTHSHSGVES